MGCVYLCMKKDCLFVCATFSLLKGFLETYGHAKQRVRERGTQRGQNLFQGITVHNLFHPLES